MNLRTKLAGLVALAAVTTPAFAQIKLNDNVSITGWAVGSYQYNSVRASTGSAAADSSNLDAALLGATITPTKDVTAVFSTYYRPTSEGGATASGNELSLLDAYVSYAPNGSLTITAGKFLSYLGYESFYLADDNQISLANQQFLAPIPGYHEGVKLDYTIDKANTIGAAFVDSLYSEGTTVSTPASINSFAAGNTEGSGSLRGTDGAEAYYQYTGVDGLTVWFGYGYDKKAAAPYPNAITGATQSPAGNYTEPHSVSVFDLWATYTLGKNDSVTAEEIYKDGGAKFGATSGEGSDWLVEESHNWTAKFASLARISGEDVTAGYSFNPTNGFDPRSLKYTLSPSYAVTANLTIRAEYSYTHYSNDYIVTTLNANHTAIVSDANFVGLQAVLKF